MNIKTNTGFTLIELLVVVLIIGILAAVALPQYQTVVNKSRAAQAFVALKALADAQERYFLETGVYATGFEQLDANTSPGCAGVACPVGDYIYQLWAGNNQLAVYMGDNLTDETTADMSISYFYADPPVSSSYYPLGVRKGYYMCDPRVARGKPQWTKLCAVLSTGTQFVAGGKYYWKP